MEDEKAVGENDAFFKDDISENSRHGLKLSETVEVSIHPLESLQFPRQNRYNSDASVTSTATTSTTSTTTTTTSTTTSTTTRDGSYFCLIF